ncbi:MAG: hypothetical protein ABG776_11260 [Cyanobacteria bacterium J06555_13]
MHLPQKINFQSLKNDKAFPLHPLLKISCLSLLSSIFIWPVLSSAASAQFARLYEVDGGAVYLRRSNWKNFYQTYPRTMLLGDDLLNVEVGADVVLLCPDGYLSDSIQVGVSNVGATCVGTPRSVRPTFGVSSDWHAMDATRPYVITPWSEQVLTATPPLSWNPVEGASQYEVTLQRREGEAWETMWTVTSEQSSMDYPADEPELESGEEYALWVAIVGEEIASLEEAPASKLFSLIDGFDQQDLAKELAKVEAFEVDELTKTLILVEEIYPRYKLFAQGTRELTALIETGTENELIHRLLGDYYIRSGLALPAEASYLKAVELAQAGENIEEEALASWGLGTLYARTDQMQQACTYLQKSQKLADELGDTDLMASIEAEMERLAVNNE